MPKRFFSILFLLVILLLLLKPLALQAQSNNTNQSQTNSIDQPLISQLASQNMAESSSIFNPLGQILNGLSNTINTSEIYQSIREFWYKDIFGGFFNGIVQAINQFLHNLHYVYLPSTVIWLCNIIKQFFLNTDLTKIQNTSTNSHDFAFLLNQFNGTIFSIALDISLLLFILSIWRYWVDAAWKGSGNLMSPVARLIFAVGLLLSWPTIYSFQIQLSNELMNALIVDSNGDIQILDLAVSGLFENLFRAGLLAGIVPNLNSGFLVETLLPIAKILVPIILCLLAIVLIYELIYVIILKAIQNALMTAQYVFAPIFLVLLTNPVTDSIATSYIRTFVEVSLWNFIWIGLLKILVILLYSNFNPWGKLLTAIGILQIMMDVPQFLAHAKISVASDFVNPHYFVKAVKGIANYDEKVKEGMKKMRSVFNKSDDNTGNTTTSNTSDPALKENNFNFASNCGQNPNLSPPIRKTNAENSGNPQSNHSNQSQPNSNTNGVTGAFAAGAGAIFGSTISASNTTNGSATAISSSNSTAMALALAIASVGNSPGTANSPNRPNSPGPGPKPKSPNSPSAPGSDPKPYIGPNGGPSGSSPYIRPNDGPSGPGSSMGPNGRPPGPSPYFGPGRDPALPSLYVGPNNGPSDLNPHSDPNNGPPSPYIKPNNSPLGSKPGLALNFGASARPFISRPDQLKIFASPMESSQSAKSLQTDHNEQAKLNSVLESKEASSNLLTNEEAQKSSFIAAPALIFSRIDAFHTGTLNYPLRKSKNRPPIMRSFLANSSKVYGECNTSAGLSSYNLIFSHGNSPTLMGIPPVYPEANKT
jgi:hypothetical protein